ncbi:hypothetical protein IBX65_07945 [Candidatus Aerophobetes bacterium]|nr:hypothetical protein [Candidatus Aerophobetes bacterium]
MLTFADRKADCDEATGKQESLPSSLEKPEDKKADELRSWEMVIKEVKQKKRALGSFLEKMKVLSVEDNLIVLGSEVNFLKDVLEKEENKKLICEELKKFFPEKFSLQFKQIIPKKGKDKPPTSLREIVAEAIEIFEGELVNR